VEGEQAGNALALVAKPVAALCRVLENGVGSAAAIELHLFGQVPGFKGLAIAPAVVSRSQQGEAPPAVSP